MGEFAIVIFNRCTSLGIDINLYKDKILSVPTSSVAYEFTRKIYSILGMDISCIAEQFLSCMLHVLFPVKCNHWIPILIQEQKSHPLLALSSSFCDSSEYEGMHHSNGYSVDHSLQIPGILSRPLRKLLLSSDCH